MKKPVPTILFKMVPRLLFSTITASLSKKARGNSSTRFWGLFKSIGYCKRKVVNQKKKKTKNLLIANILVSCLMKRLVK